MTRLAVHFQTVLFEMKDNIFHIHIFLYQLNLQVFYVIDHYLIMKLQYSYKQEFHFYWLYQKHSTRFFSKDGLRSPLEFGKFTSPTFEIEDLKKMGPSFFRACLNELSKTGYLSNRARQIFASIWINDLKLDWRLGAELFERYLIASQILEIPSPKFSLL